MLDRANTINFQTIQKADRKTSNFAAAAKRKLSRNALSSAMGHFNDTSEGPDYLHALSGQRVLDRVETNLVSEEAPGSKSRYGRNGDGSGQKRNCRTLLVEPPSGVHDPW